MEELAVLGIAAAEGHGAVGQRVHTGACREAHHVAVARGAGARGGHGRGGEVLGAAPGLDHLGVHLVSAAGQDDALGGVDLRIRPVVHVLDDGARHAAVAVLQELDAGGLEAHVDVVVRGDGFVERVHDKGPEQPGRGAGVVERVLALHRVAFLVGGADLDAARAAVEHFLHEVDGGAGVVDERPDVLLADAVVARRHDGVDILGWVDLDALLLLREGVVAADALPLVAAAVHLLDAHDLGTVGGRLCRGHEAGHAAADDENVALERLRNLVGTDLASLEGHGALVIVEQGPALVGHGHAAHAVPKGRDVVYALNTGRIVGEGDGGSGSNCRCGGGGGDDEAPAVHLHDRIPFLEVRPGAPGPCIPPVGNRLSG